MALCIRERTSKVVEYEGRCQIKPNKGSGGDVSIGTQPEEEGMQGDQIIETTD